MNNTNSNSSLFINKEFKIWLGSRFFTNFAKQMQGLVISWQVYQISKDPVALGGIGLSEALPFFVVALWAGHLADTRERRRLLILSQWGQIVCSGVLFVMTWMGRPNLLLIYAMVGGAGMATGVEVAAAGSYIQTLIPKEIFQRAAAWNLTLFTSAMVFGPVIGGWIVAHSRIEFTYLIMIIFFVLSAYMTRKLPKIFPSINAQEDQDSGFERIRTGLAFIWKKKILLSSMSLDLFAVLFGGAVALFPIFADLLGVNATGLGWLRAAPALGAFVMAVSQIRKSSFKPTWNLLCWVVGIFGFCWIGFALSINFYLSLFFLSLSGMVDSVSVIIRSSLLQAHTPEHLRGRVVAVGSIFIRSSNEVGAFESGVAAKLMGTIPSVIFGGCMTLFSVALMRWFFPHLNSRDSIFSEPKKD